MDPSLNGNLITTKDAGELSGYTSDYLARLVRSGKISGKKIGHSWFVGRESLIRFLDRQEARKSDYSRALARAREAEYRSHRHAARIPQMYKRISAKLNQRISADLDLRSSAFSGWRSQLAALSVAAFVVTGAAFAAQTPIIPQAARALGSFARVVAFGFREISADPYQRISADLNQRKSASFRNTTKSEDAHRTYATSEIKDISLSPLFVLKLDARPVRNLISNGASGGRGTSPITSRELSASEAQLLEDSILETFAFLSSPERMRGAILHAPANVARVGKEQYLALGENSYGAVEKIFSTYRSLLDVSGREALAFAATARDALAASPSFVNRVNLAFGNAVIDLTHAAIQADVSLAYVPATAAPEVSALALRSFNEAGRATVALVGNTGDLLARATVAATIKTPEKAGLALRSVSEAGPRIAQAVFDAEYALAHRFVGATAFASDRYLALVTGTGDLAYAGVAAAQPLTLAPRRFSEMVNDPQIFSAVGRTIVGAYEATRGKGPALLENMNREGTPVAAVISQLSAGEKVALTTYRAINNFWDSATSPVRNLISNGASGLAYLLNPAPAPVIVYSPTSPKPATKATKGTASSPTSPKPATKATKGTASSPTSPKPATKATKGTASSTPAATSAPASAYIIPVTSLQQPASNFYTTVVEGVTQDYVTLSLNALKNDILSTVGGMLSPISRQTATNITTIQQVARIEKLDNLTINNGTFGGGTFDRSTLTNGISVAAAEATFGRLTITGGTTFSGNLVLASSTATAGGVYVNSMRFLHNYGTDNTFLGLDAGNFTMTGTQNTGIGANTLTANTTGLYNTAIGNLALNANTTGDYNTAIGGYTLPVNTTGRHNTALGLQVLTANTTGSYNTALGSLVLDANTTGDYNTVAGYQAASVNTTGNFNAGYGYRSLRYNTTGSNNAAFGTYAGWTNTTGTYNTFLGHLADAASSTLTNATAIGANAIVGASNSLVLGGTGANAVNVGIGTTSPYSLLSISNSQQTTVNTPLFTIASTTGGTSTSTLMTVLANGKIGIGKAVPTRLLDILGSGSGQTQVAITGADPNSRTQVSIQNDGNSYGAVDVYGTTQTGNLFGALQLNNSVLFKGNMADAGGIVAFGATSNNPVVFGTNNLERMRIDTAGNVGIGTTSPYSLLSISNSASTAVDTPLFTIASTTAGTSTSTLVTVLANGRVGIGTQAPLGALNILTSGGDTAGSNQVLTLGDSLTGGRQTWGFRVSTTAVDTNGGDLHIERALGGVVNTVLSLTRSKSAAGVGTTTPWGKLSVTNGDNSFPSFVVEDTASPDSTPFIIDSDGNVGIGTSTPSSKFSVNGASLLNGGVTIDGAGSGLTFTGTGNHDIVAAGGTLRIGSNIITGNIEALDGTQDIGTPSVRFDKIYANEVSAVTVVGTIVGGNVQAETLTVNSDNTSADQESAYLVFARGSSSPNAQLAWNAATSSKRFEFNQPLYIQDASLTSATSTLFVQGWSGQTSDLFRIASSSDTVTPYLTVTSAGNVGIGTTTPAEQLEITGNFRLPVTTTAVGQIKMGDNRWIDSYGTGNLMIGTNGAPAGNTTLTGTYNIGIGGDLVLSSITTGTSNIAIGRYGLKSLTTGNNNSVLGYLAGASLTTASNNVAIGTSALNSNVTTDGLTALGAYALADTTGVENTGLGLQAGYHISTGAYNTAVGSNAIGGAIVTGDFNTAVGRSAMSANTSGASNIGIGVNVLLSNTTGSYNIAMGQSALQTATSSSNQVAIGYQALLNMITGPSNDTEGNVALGYNAGNAITYGGGNILLGYQAGDALTTGSRNIILGYDIDAPAVTSSNILNIGNLIYGTGIDGTGTTLSSGNVGIGTTSPSGKLTVEAASGVVNSAESAGTLVLRSSDAAAIDKGPQLRFSGFGGGATGALAFATIAGRMESNPNAGYLQFSTTQTDSTIAERMRITSTGNVGIGTAGPNYKLDIATASSNTQIRFGSDGTNSGGFLISTADSQGNIAGGMSWNGSSYVARSTMASQVENYLGNIRFFTNSGLTAGNSFTPTERMRIDTSGNVGIGTASPGSGIATALTTSLHIGPGSGTNPGIVLQDNSNSKKHILRIIDDAFWISADDGSIQRTDIAIKSDTGNVGIGTTSPAALLSVHGNSYVSGTGFFGGAITGTSTLAVGTSTLTNLIVTNTSTSTLTGGLVAGTNVRASLPSDPTWYTEISAENSGSYLKTAGYSVLNLRVGATNVMALNGSSNTLAGNLGLSTSKILGVDNIAYIDLYNPSTGNIHITNTSASATYGNILFETGASATEQMRITNSGNVGIGTTSPYAKLSVVGETVSQYFTATSTTATSTFAGGLSAGNAGLLVMQNGAVQIGGSDRFDFTPGPTSIFTINNPNSNSIGINLNTGDSQSAFVNFSRSSAVKWGLGLPYSASDNFVISKGNAPAEDSSAVFTILSSNNNVGIGTTSPNNNLQVVSGAAGSAPLAITNTSDNYTVRVTSSGALPYWQFTNAAVSAVVNAGIDASSLNLGRGNVQIIGSDTPTASTIPARLYVVGDGTNPAAIFNTGNIGIGTTTPSARLDIVPTTVPSQTYAPIMILESRLANGYSEQGGYIGFRQVDVGNNVVTNDAARIVAVHDNFQAEQGDTGLSFWTTPANLSVAERVRISSTGNVGIGTTTPGVLLDVVKNSTSDNGTIFPTVRVRNLSTSDKSYAQFQVDVAGGGVTSYWQGEGVGTGKLGTPGAFIGTYTNHPFAFVTNDSEKMRLTAGGNLGIGETAPGSKLSVSGGATIGASYDTTVAPTNGLIVEGNVGIGTTSPYSLLSISNSAGTTVNTPLFTIASTTAGNSTSTLMTVLANGNVGIGTAAPGYTLDVTKSEPGNYVANFYNSNTTNGSHGMYVNVAQGSNTNALVVATEGTPRLTVNSTGVVSGGNFTTTSGYIGYDVNHNLNWTGSAYRLLSNADPITFVGAYELMRITAAGLVGIGSTTPWGQLSASSTSAYPTLAIEQKSTGPAAVFLGGNVGIGTTSPASLFSVHGNGLFSGNITAANITATGTLTAANISTTGYLSTSNAAVGGDDWYISAGDSGHLGFFKDSTAVSTNGKMVLTTGGLLGVGGGLNTATVPAEELEVYSSSGVTAIRITGDSNQGAPELQFNMRNGVANQAKIVGSSGESHNSPELQFYVNTGADSTNTLVQRMTINDLGKVGIGTTSPYSLLSISNSAGTTANTPLFTIASTTGGTSTSTLMTVLANGRVGIGTAGPSTLFDIVSNSSATSTIRQFLTSDAGPALQLIHARGTASAPSATCGVDCSSDTLGQIDFMGYDGSAYQTGARIIAEAAGNGSWSPGGLGTSLVFYGVDTNTSSLAERMRFQPNSTVEFFGLGASGLSLTGSQMIVSSSFRFGYGGTTQDGYVPATGPDGWGMISSTGSFRVNLDADNDNTGQAFVIGHHQTDGDATNNVLMVVNDSGNVGIGTTTPNWLLQAAGTRPSFALSDSSAGANLKHWLFSSMGGNLYVGTSTDAYGTSTPAALTITNAGNVGIGKAIPNFLAEFSRSDTTSTRSGNISAEIAVVNDLPGTNYGPGAGIRFLAPTGGVTPTPSVGRILGTFGGNCYGNDCSLLVFQTTTGANVFSDAMIISGTEVSIGTPTINPAVPLEVVGSVAPSSVGAAGILQLYRGVNDGVSYPNIAEFALGRYQVGDTNPYSRLDINLKSSGSFDKTGDVTVMTLQANGNVGIGTTSPGALLSISGGPASILFNRPNNSHDGGLTLDSNGAALWKVGFIGGLTSNNFYIRDGKDDKTLLAFAAAGLDNAISVSATQVAIASTLYANGSGNVGIGTTSPAALTSIGGDLFVGASTAGGTNGKLGIGVANPVQIIHAVGSTPYIRLDDSASSPAGKIVYFGNNAGRIILGTDAGTSGRKFSIGYNAPDDSMFIADSTGNVGIGTTSPLNLLHIATSGDDMTFGGNAGANVAGNLYYSSGWKYIEAAGGAAIGINDNNRAGDIGFYTAPSGAVGSAATLSARMYIQEGGNVGIGTTSPDALLNIQNYGGGQGLNSQFIVNSGYAAGPGSISMSVVNSGNVFLGFDVDEVAAAMVARGTAASMLRELNGELLFTGDTGLTMNSAFTPTTRMTLDLSNGKFGIGSTTPWGQLSASSTSAYPTLAIEQKSTGPAAVFLGGNVGIGVTNPTSKLVVAGSTSASPNDYVAVFRTIDDAANRPIIRIENSAQSELARWDYNGYLTAPGFYATSNYVLSVAPGNIIIASQSGSTLQMGDVNGKAQKLSLYSNGVESLTIDTSGNVGIGTTSPWGVLSVTNAGSGPSFVVEDTESPDATPFTIDAGGSVGIGVSNPALSLQVNGAAGVPANSGTTATGRVRFSGTDNIAMDFGALNTSPWSAWIQVHDSTDQSVNYPLSLQTNGGNVGIGTTNPGATLQVGTNVLTVSATTSNVGIGTVSPLATLHVAGDIFQPYSQQIRSGLDNTSIYGYLELYNTSTGNLTLQAHSANNRSALINPNGGNVGIGTTSPWADLHVRDTAQSAGITDTPDSWLNALFERAWGSSSAAGIAIVGSSKSTGGNGVVYLGNSDDWDNTALSGGNDVFKLYVGATIPFITAQGTGSGDGKLSIATTSANQVLTLYQPANDVAIELSALAGPTYKWTMGMDYSDGGKFKIASSSALGTDDRFVIDGNGNVGIGTTSPESRLAVAQPSAISSTFDLATLDANTNVTNASGVTQRGLVLKMPTFTMNNAPATLTGARIETGSPGQFDQGGDVATVRGIEITSGNWLGNTGGFTWRGVQITTPTMRKDHSGGNAQESYGIDITTGATTGSGTNGINTGLRITGGSQSNAGIQRGLHINMADASHAALIVQTGNVGIGTTTPGVLLDVYKSSNLVSRFDSGSHNYLRLNRGAVTNNNELEFQTNGTTNWAMGLGDDSENKFYITTNNAVPSDGAKLTITTAGNVGIGTTSPVGHLEIANTTTNNTRLILRGTTGNGAVLINGTDLTTAQEWFKIDAFGRASFDEQAQSTAETPAVNISNLTGYGIFGSSYLGFTTNASEKMRITSGGNVGIGTTSPYSILSISNAAGTAVNTPLFTIASTTAGTSTSTLMTVLANGNVGIGAAAPGGKLSVAGNIFFGDESHYLSTDNSTYAMLSSNRDVQLSISGNPKLTVQASTGNVGIGTTTPTNTLTVSGTRVAGSLTSVAKIGTSGFGGQTGDAIGLLFSDTATGGYDFARIQTRAPGGSNMALDFGVWDGSTISNYMTIIKNGNVGIGTTSPQSKLHVTGGFSGITPLAGTVLTVENSGSNYLSLLAPNANEQALLFGSPNNVADGGVFYSPNGLSRGMSFRTGGNATQMVINSTGNVGIGTTTPLSILQTTTGGDNYFVMDNKNYATSEGIWRLHVGNTTDFFSIEQNTAAVRDFSTSYTPFFIGGVSGGYNQRVGIGTTTPGSKLSIAGGVSVGTNYGAAAPTNGMIIEGNVGIGTTSPGTLLSLGDTGANTINISATATSTFGSGIDIRTGCFAINGVCVGGGSGTGTVGSGTAGQFPYYAGTGTTLTATSSLYVATNERVGIASSTPFAKFAVENTSAALSFAVNDQAGDPTPFVIDDSGDVGIGTASPGGQSERFSIVTTAGSASAMTIYNGSDPNYIGEFGIDASTGNLIITSRLVGSGVQPIYMSASAIGLGTTTPATLLEVGGETANVTFDGYKNCTGFTSNGNGLLACSASDERLKQDISPLATASGLSAIDALRPVSFYWDPAAERSSQKQFGLIAQQVREVFPDLVQTSAPTSLTPDGTLSINYDGLAAPMILAIQELSTTSTRLAGRVGTLENEITALTGGYFGFSYEGSISARNEPVTAPIIANWVYASSTPASIVENLQKPAEGIEPSEIEVTGSFPHQAAGLFTVYGNVAADSFVASTSVWTSNLAVTNEGYINRLTAQEVSATSFVNTSTRALKTDINYMSASSTEAVLGKVRGLKVATYRYAAEAGSNPLRLGLIAEDARETAPEILSIDGNGVDLYKLATLTLAGVQTLAEKVDRAEVRLTSLEARLAALESGAVSSASGSPVSFSTTSLASAFNAFGAYIAKGIAQFGTLVADQFVAATNSAGTSSAGTVKIIAGNTVAEVQNAYVKPSTKIFVTFTASTTGSWYIAEKKDGSFRLVLESPQAGDTSFDYFLIQTEGQMATSTPESQISNSQFSISNSNTSTQWITVLGDNPYLIEVGGNFVDPGIDAGGAPVTTYINGVESEVGPGTIDTSSETTYIITYRVLGPNGSIMATRSVIVGNGSVVAGTTSQESQVTSQESSATPESEVISPDSDSQPPIVTLNGEAAMQISEGQTFTDPGATATDETDGDLTAKIATSGSADTATAGSYTLTYSATDAAGNTGSVSRLVTVIEPLSAATETSTTPQ